MVCVGMKPPLCVKLTNSRPGRGLRRCLRTPQAAVFSLFSSRYQFVQVMETDVWPESKMTGARCFTWMQEAAAGINALFGTGSSEAQTQPPRSASMQEAILMIR